jgi:hypothetical protein
VFDKTFTGTAFGNNHFGRSMGMIGEGAKKDNKETDARQVHSILVSEGGRISKGSFSKHQLPERKD